MKNQNEMCQNEKQCISQEPAFVVAGIVGCSESLVKQVRTKQRNANKGLGAKIAYVDDLLTYGKNALINEIKLLVPLK